MADKIEYGKEKDVEGEHRGTADAHCPHCEGHEGRIVAIESKLGLNRKPKTPEEVMRERKRS